jgi:uncharacterized protein (TIGR03435 family)
VAEQSVEAGRRHMKIKPAGLVLLALGCGMSRSQTPAAKPAFEVVSIKPGSTEPFMALARSGKLHSNIDDAQVDLGCITLSSLIEMAYGVPDDRISGPDWMRQAPFDVLAKLPAGSSKKQVPEMLQTMLADRFKLTVRREQKVMPVYELVMGKPPLKLKESARDDSDPIFCNGGPVKGHTCHKVSMEDLARILTQVARMNGSMPVSWGIDRPVVDLTGLKGIYDFTMNYGRLGGRGARGGNAVAGDPGEITVMDGIRELGLKLEPGKHAFDFIVVEHVERVPTEN